MEEEMTHEYKIVQSSGSGLLGIAVTHCLAEGWELWGNPFLLTYDMVENGYICQAMVRQVESEHGGMRMAQEPAGYTVGVPETPAVEELTAEEAKLIRPSQVPSLADFRQLGQVIGAEPGKVS
jgi:hypothetical protein